MREHNDIGMGDSDRDNALHAQEARRYRMDGEQESRCGMTRWPTF